MKQLTLIPCIEHERTIRIKRLTLRLLESDVPTMMGWKYTDVIAVAKSAVSRGIARRYYS